MWIYYNPNPKASRVGDCVIRAISKLMDRTWEEIYIDLCIEGYKHCDLPSSNAVWGAYLYKHGYVKKVADCGMGCTVEEFCRYHPEGKYLLALDGHVVCTDSADYFDTWDSGHEHPAYYWEEKK